MKEKNVIEREKKFREVVRSENLQTDVAVSLEEMLVIIRNFRAEISSVPSTECTGSSSLE
jgi:hypothetical protein